MKGLEERLGRIEAALERLAGQGKTLLRVGREPEPSERADYIPFGSERHAQFLGLIEVTDDDAALAQELGYVTLEDPETGRVWRLNDEESALRCYPAYEPEIAIKRVLMQKLSTLNGGAPVVPESAKPLWRPSQAHEAMAGLGMAANEVLIIEEPGSILGV